MQHNRAGRKLGRTTAHRRALFKNQLTSLLLHERITTTLPKAKELRPLAEKLITLGKQGGLHARRLALRKADKDAVRRLFDEIAPRFKTRAGGYTRILKLGPRLGDGAETAILQFVDFDFAQKRAEKKAAEKAAGEKKESLIERARKLITGKGAAERDEPAAEAAESGAPKAEEAEKKPKAKAEKAPKVTTAPKAPKSKAAPKVAKKSPTPRKTGSS